MTFAFLLFSFGLSPKHPQIWRKTRKKGRDLFDLWLCLRDHNAVAKDILFCFQEYMKRGGHDITLALFTDNLDAKMGDKRFTQDISPLVRPELVWNLIEAMNLVRQELLSSWSAL